MCRSCRNNICWSNSDRETRFAGPSVSDATAQAAVLVGHWTDEERRTGCTVILFDRLVPTVVDIRGGAPGSRETDLLAADRTVGAVDAILFTGGSAHGLGAAEGVMQYLREHERG